MNNLSKFFEMRSPRPHDFAAYPKHAPLSATFSHKDYDEILSKHGFVIFPWLSSEEVDELTSVVANVSHAVDYGDAHIATPFRLSAFTNDASFKSRLYDAVYGLLSSRLALLLPDYEPLVINLFEKPPHSGHDAVPIHQNPSFVEEPEHKSVS